MASTVSWQVPSRDAVALDVERVLVFVAVDVLLQGAVGKAGDFLRDVRGTPSSKVMREVEGCPSLSTPRGGARCGCGPGDSTPGLALKALQLIVAGWRFPWFHCPTPSAAAPGAAGIIIVSVLCTQG